MMHCKSQNVSTLRPNDDFVFQAVNYISQFKVLNTCRTDIKRTKHKTERTRTVTFHGKILQRRELAVTNFRTIRIGKDAVRTIYHTAYTRIMRCYTRVILFVPCYLMNISHAGTLPIFQSSVEFVRFCTAYVYKHVGTPDSCTYVQVHE